MMKKNLGLLISVPIVAVALISGVLYPDGSPGAKTGSPLDGSICAQCHICDVKESFWISSNIPSEGWKPGETYTITLLAESDTANLIGFEVTAESESTKAGTFIITDKERTQFINNENAVTHSHNGTMPTDGINIWQVNWQAPIQNSGTISFYAAFNCANGDATSEGDQIYASNISYEQSQLVGVRNLKTSKFKVYPNPAINEVKIESSSSITELNLYNTNGQLVKSFLNLEADKNQLDIHDLQRGHYVLKVSSNNEKYSQFIQLN